MWAETKMKNELEKINKKIKKIRKNILLWHSGKSFIDFSHRFKPIVSFRMQAQIKNKATLNMRVGLPCW